METIELKKDKKKKKPYHNYRHAPEKNLIGVGASKTTENIKKQQQQKKQKIM